MPNKNLYVDSFKRPIGRPQGLPLHAKLLLAICVLVFGGVSLGLILFSHQDIARGKNNSDVLGTISTRNGYKERYTTITNGAITFTGNALQVANPQYAPGNLTSVGNNTGGTFMTTNDSLQDPPFGNGTTSDWRQSSSTAQLRIPNGAEILYAELIWGGNYSFRTDSVADFLDNPVGLTLPNGQRRNIAPDPSTSGIAYYDPDNGSNDRFYVRTQNVTDIIRTAGAGNYTVSGVPAIVNRENNSSNGSGWTLAVVYRDDKQPSRKISLYTTLEPIEAGTRGNVVAVQNFATPPQGRMGGRILLSALEGDQVLAGDQFTFGDDPNNLTPISGPNNPADNFFGSQINGDDGQLDRSGTRGNLNQVPGRIVGNERHGWDITNVDVSQYIRPGQTRAYAQATSQADGYLITALGVQIDVNSPKPEVTIRRDKDNVRVGETITYTIDVKNNGAIDSQNSILSSFVPEGTSLVPGSFKIDNRPATGDPTQGVSLGNIPPDGTHQIVFTVKVDRLPPSNLFENEASVKYEYIQIAGSDPIRAEVNSSKVVTFGLQPIGEPPVARDDTATTKKNTPVTIDVLANDSDPENSLSNGSLKIITPTKNGTVTIQNGRVVYTPNNNYVGSDDFTYEICDTDQNCVQAKGTITVTDPKPPVATPDTATTKQDTPVTIPIKNNDTDPLKPTITPDQIKVTTPPRNGTVGIDPITGEAKYTPNPNYSGPDSFEYTLTNPDGTSTARVDINVEKKIVPTAVDDTATTKENVPVRLPLPANDNPGQGAQFDLPQTKIVTQPTNGTVTIYPATGEATYTPKPGFSGTDTFTYEITNNLGEKATATATVIVQPITPPDAADDTAITKAGEPVKIPVLKNDKPGEGQLVPSTTKIVDQPTNGTVRVDPTTGDITYSPDPGFTGKEDFFVYEICNDKGKCDTANVVVKVNDKKLPDAVNDNATTDKGNPVNIPILNNDKDPIDGIQPKDFKRIVRQPTNGTVTVNPTTGIATYTPNPNFSGADSFDYEICNADGCDTATVSVDIKAPGKPDAVDDKATTNEGTPVTIPVTNNDRPGDGRTLDPDTIKVTIPPKNGTVIKDPVSGGLKYSPAPDFSGQDTFTYQVCNDKGECDTANVTVDVTPKPRPDAKNDEISTPQDKPVTIPVLKNDLGDPDPSTVQIINPPANGTVTVDPKTGEITYTPNPSFAGVERFTYKICNDFGKCDSAVVTVKVEPKSVTPTDPIRDPVFGGQAGNRPTPKVLGAYDNQELPRTGGLDQIAGDIMLVLGLILSAGFFGSLYFAKAKETKKK
jgi:uncharacterized repeat protein (TIGR01451 family)